MVCQIFCKSDYSLKHPIKNVRMFFWCCKLAYQRVKRGYCDQDTRDISNWFLGVFPDMLHQYAGADKDFYFGGFPVILIEQYYEKHKKEISVSYDEFMNGRCDDRVRMWVKKCDKECSYRWRKKILPEIEARFRKLKENWDECIYNTLEERDAATKEAFALLGEWFNCLWD